MERVDGPCRGEPSPRKPLLIHCRHDATEPLTLVLPDSESFFEVPYSQSGALNEHFSDVFGSAIQQYYNKQDAGEADWLVGNEIMGQVLFGESLRSMRAPGAAYNNSLMGNDPQPSHMRDYYAGSDDNQGVHINSGIPNRAFFLVASDIGTDKAILIWYQALRMLWPDANFNDAVEVISDAARLLTKTGKVPQGSTQTVRLAFQEVGLPLRGVRFRVDLNADVLHV